MRWFAVTCILAVIPWLLGLGWIWGSVFVVMSLCSIALVVKRVRFSRRCIEEVERSLTRKEHGESLCDVVAKHFGDTPKSIETDGAEFAGNLAFVPIAMLVFVGFMRLIDSNFWSATISIVAAVPLSMILQKLVDRHTTERQSSLDKVKQLVLAHDPNQWDVVLKELDERLDRRLRVARDTAERGKTLADETFTCTACSKTTCFACVANAWVAQHGPPVGDPNPEHVVMGSILEAGSHSEAPCPMCNRSAARSN
jgi:hypothetical protein